MCSYSIIRISIRLLIGITTFLHRNFQTSYTYTSNSVADKKLFAYYPVCSIVMFGFLSLKAYIILLPEFDANLRSSDKIRY